MRGEVVDDRYLRRTLWQGYDRGDVDALLACVVSDLDAGRPPHASIEGATLRREWWGYAAVDVDWLLDRLRAEGGSHVARRTHRTLLVSLAMRVVVILGTAALLGAVLGAAALATLVAVLLVAYVPFGARRGYRTLVFRVRVDPSCRAWFFVSSIVLKWAYVGVIALIGAFASKGSASIGLGLGESSPRTRAITIVAVLVAIAVLIPPTLRLRHARPGSMPNAQCQLRGTRALLPRTRTERLVFVGMAITAGVTEEILYRGYLIAYLRWWRPGVSDLAVIVVTSAAFGMAHLYQGRRPALLIGVVGALFAWLTLYSGSLVPAIVLHSIFDLRLLAIPEWLVADELLPSPG
jgi:uncharacterized protein